MFHHHFMFQHLGQEWTLRCSSLPRGGWSLVFEVPQQERTRRSTHCAVQVWQSRFSRKFTSLQAISLTDFYRNYSHSRVSLQARFQDQASLNYLSDRSVDNLRALIKDPSADVTHRNFRPNIVLDTKFPHEEDFWSRVRIGQAETEFHRRCTRCVLTTIDPDSGVKTEKEPLETMRK